jgi:predicted transposase YbfD/YdcC
LEFETKTKKPRKVKMKSNTKELTTGKTQPGEGALFSMDSLYSYLAKISDTRKRRGIRYQLATVLVIMVIAKLCGEDKPFGIAEWAQLRSPWLIEALQLRNKRLPHHSTYRRVLSDVVAGDELEALVSEYVQQEAQAGQEVVIALDGKTIRGTITPTDPFGLHLLAAYLPGEGLVLLQMVVEKDKENEIVVAPKLLKCLDLRHKVVVGDAMQTQRQLSVQIVAAGGHFVWIVKDNQAKTRQAIEQLFAPEKPVPGLGCPAMDFRCAKTVDKAHGRLEERSLTASSLLNDYLDWPHLGQVFKLERRFTYLASGKVVTDTQYGLTDLSAQEASPERLLEIVRSEWSIENGLHYRRDVTFHEDATRMTQKPMARAMTIINNLVIALLNRQGFSNHAQARRFFDAQPDKTLALLC